MPLSICTACRRTKRPAREAMVRTRNMALVTGLRLNGLAMTRKPKIRVSAAKM